MMKHLMTLLFLFTVMVPLNGLSDTYKSEVCSTTSTVCALIQSEMDFTTKSEGRFKLSLKGKERLEYIDEAFGGGAASAQFLSLVNDVDGKLGSLTEAMNNHKETAIKITQEEENQRKANTEKIIRNFDRVAEHLASKTEFFHKGDDEEANAEVENRIKAAKAIMLGEATENDMMMTPFLAVMAKDAISKLAKVEAELEKYKARAKSDSAVQPRINRSSSDDESKSSKPKSALESIRSSLRGL